MLTKELRSADTQAEREITAAYALVFVWYREKGIMVYIPDFSPPSVVFFFKKKKNTEGYVMQCHFQKYPLRGITLHGGRLIPALLS